MPQSWTHCRKVPPVEDSVRDATVTSVATENMTTRGTELHRLIQVLFSTDSFVSPALMFMYCTSCESLYKGAEIPTTWHLTSLYPSIQIPPILKQRSFIKHIKCKKSNLGSGISVSAGLFSCSLNTMGMVGTLCEISRKLSLEERLAHKKISGLVSSFVFFVFYLCYTSFNMYQRTNKRAIQGKFISKPMSGPWTALHERLLDRHAS